MSSKDYIKDPKINNLGVFETTTNIYIIPSYQRSYAWSKDRVISFWDELIISDNKSGYNISFTGSVILKHNKETDESDHFEVIDGQQRFITTSILIAVLRDYSKFLIKNKYKKNKEMNVALDDIIVATEKMLRISERGVTTLTPRVNVGKTIYDIYEKIIINHYGLDEVKKLTLSSMSNSHQENILRNYKTFEEKVFGYVGDENEDEKINNLLDKLKTIDFIEIIVTDDVAAYEIFETVNSKNEPLTSSDLIKNLILRELKSESEIYEDKWNQSISNIAEVGGFNFNQYLRYFWLSKYGWSTDKKLYANFKFHLGSLKKKDKKVEFLKEFVNDLLSDSLNFRRLTSPGFDNYYRETFASAQQYDKKIIKSLNTIKALNIKQCYVLLLSLIRNVTIAKEKIYEKGSFDQVSRAFSLVIKKIEIFSLLFHVLGKGQANKVEKGIYHSIALEIQKFDLKIQEIMENPVITPKNKPANIDKYILKQWTDIIINKIHIALDNLMEQEDIDIERAINKLDYNKTIDYIVIKYIFELTNQYVYKQKAFSFNENSTVEHILPKSCKKWELEFRDIESFVNTIGNFIIIDNELNRDLSNETLTNKLNGFITPNEKEVSYYDDKCELNIKLFDEIKEDLKNYKQDKEYWNEARVRDRGKNITKEFKEAISRYVG